MMTQIRFHGEAARQMIPNRLVHLQHISCTLIKIDKRLCTVISKICQIFVPIKRYFVLLFNDWAAPDNIFILLLIVRKLWLIEHSVLKFLISLLLVLLMQFQLLQYIIRVQLVLGIADNLTLENQWLLLMIWLFLNLLKYLSWFLSILKPNIFIR